MQKYSKAPIVEAIIDIRVAARTEVSILDLADSFVNLRSDYPQRESFLHAPPFFADSTDSIPNFVLAMPPQGLRYQNHDGTKVFQARNDGFTFSVLPPYGDWENFRDEAKTLWNQYVQARQPDRLTRVAVRYVNRLPIPKDDPLSDFLTLLPSFYPQLGDLREFQTRLQFPQPDLEAILLLTQATLVAQPGEDFAPILLDIDLFRDRIPWMAQSDDLWAFLERIRERKNFVFEACLTPKMKEHLR